jgi:hypothetical protein
MRIYKNKCINYYLLYIYKMHIFRISKTGSGNITSRKIVNGAIRHSNKRIMTGGSIMEKVYEENTLRKATDNLRNLKISKPRIPKKYITFE